jgi:hypothetical protein
MPPLISMSVNILFVVLGSFVLKYKFSEILSFVYGDIPSYLLNKCIYLSLFATATSNLVFHYLFIRYKYSVKLKSESRQIVFRSRLFIIGLFILFVSLITLALLTGSFGYFVEESNQGLTNLTDKLYFVSLCLGLLLSVKIIDNKIATIYPNILCNPFLLIMSGLGSLSGSKSLIILPFLSYFLVDYIISKTFFNKSFKYLVFVFFFAFIIINPIRNSIESQGSISLDMVTEFKSTDFNEESGKAPLEFVNRLNYVPALSRAIEYKGLQPSSVSNLWLYTLKSPIMAIVPSFFLKLKPDETFSRWYSFNVMGSTETNNISSTMQGILFMSGGISSVFFGFVLIGFCQFIFFSIFYKNSAIIIYLILLPNLIILSAEPWIYFVTIIQNTIIFYLLNKLITR